MQVKTDSNDKGHMRFTIDFKREDLYLKYTLIGVSVHLRGFPTINKPGSPALPHCPVRIALPPHTKLTHIDTELRGTVSITNEPVPVAPQQPLRPGQREDDEKPLYHRPDEEQRSYKQTRQQNRDERPFVEPFAEPSFVPANQELYEAATHRQPAQWMETTTEGLTPVALIHLNPVRLKTDGSLEFSAQIELIVHYELDADDKQQEQRPTRLTSRAQAMRQIALTRLTVINRNDVVDFSDLFPIFYLGADYLIVTDNQQWNAQTVMPTGPVTGDIVASFKRLAAWKRQRGLRASVITITDIVAGRYGDFRTGSRDLQEVIRQFLKMAHADWGTAWVLLGGDTSIVPIRRVASDLLGGVNPQATNPPPENTSFWTGSYLRIHAVTLGDWWGASPDNLLVRQDTGLLIPYDSMGTSNTITRGWYFTTNDTYTIRTLTPTNFVRVNGPGSEVNANLQFLYNWNTIPTDLYYASLVGPQYNQPGRHDWDNNNNGIYGQHGGSNLDGINYTPAVSLGRAPVNTAIQADAFVNKVIAYEKFQRPDGTQLDVNWPRRVVLASENWDSNWGGLLSFWPSASSPPGNNSYHHVAGADHTIIKLENMPNWDRSLLATISETDVRVMPYRTDAGPATRGWYFARSATDLSVNRKAIFLSSGTVYLLQPSLWIVVYGTPQELSPANYIFNAVGLDGSLADQEELRLQLRSQMPGLNDYKRLYQDIVDMTPAQLAAAPIEQLSAPGLRNALNAGPHIVSLSGHGNSGGCCALDRFMADNLTNGYHSFIVYADSCLTNQLDADAVSEHLISNPNGGAVAYIGNTRFSWIGVGDDYQRRFFNQWSVLGGNAHLGLLNDTRALLYGSNDAYYRWVMMTLTLTGDPEMPLWWREPVKFRVPQVYFFDKIKILIDPNPPDPLSPIDLPYRKNWGVAYVHLQQGNQEQITVTNINGQAELPLTKFRSGAATLTLTSPGHQPIVQQVILSGAKTSRKDKWMMCAAVLAGVLVVSNKVMKRLKHR
ncbi:MAG TPA: C25 family cysteine peptidase [Chitinophagaceae bacterium]|nr:C25 family cysteine peptidase [Chitinophagaceae bacterium]